MAWVLTVPLGWNAALASALSYACCSLGSFFAHRLWTFQSSAPLGAELRRFIATGALGYGASVALPLGLTQVMGLDPRIAIIAVCVGASALNYVLLNLFVFRPAAHAA